MDETVEASSRLETVRSIEAGRVIAILRVKDAAGVESIVEALALGGIRIFEVTMTVPDGLAVLRRLSSHYRRDDLVFGAGTVMDAETVGRAARSGARFIVAPTFRRALVDDCHRHGVVAIPGCYSPTELLEAHEAGADLVKLFPAATLGTSFVRRLLEPLPDLGLVATGGIGLDDASGWIEAGVKAVGLGSALVGAAASPEAHAVLSERARRLLEGIRSFERAA